MTSPQGSTASERRTALYDLHVALSARMVPFAGWEMPLQYGRGIVEETRAVREHAGVFDVSHMGRLFVVGADAARMVRRAVTYDVTSLPEGRGHYALMCNDEGGILDDPYVYRLDAVRLLVVGNAINADLPTGTGNESARWRNRRGKPTSSTARRRRSCSPSRDRRRARSSPA